MAVHHTKYKGDVGLAKVISQLIEFGYFVCLPISEHAPFDLIAVDDKGKAEKIQVKYSAAKNGTIRVDLRSSWTDKNGSHMKDCDKAMIDTVAVYCPTTNECYYINVDQMSQTILIRVEDVANGQSKGIHKHHEYIRTQLASCGCSSDG